jgi:hypothetical protein
MTWSRLFHIKDINKAMARVIPGRPLEELAISKKYQAQMAKLYRLNGVPWIYNLKPEALNPRDKTPRPKRRYVNR